MYEIFVIMVLKRRLDIISMGGERPESQEAEILGACSQEPEIPRHRCCSLREVQLVMTSLETVRRARFRLFHRPETYSAGFHTSLSVIDTLF